MERYSMQDEYILFCVFWPFFVAYVLVGLHYSICQPSYLCILGVERIYNCHRPRTVVPDGNLTDIRNKLCQVCKSQCVIVYGDAEYSPERFQSMCLCFTYLWLFCRFAYLWLLCRFASENICYQYKCRLYEISVFLTSWKAQYNTDWGWLLWVKYFLNILIIPRWQMIK
jgi:uncharacterized Fe-S cluster protein YjdI